MADLAQRLTGLVREIEKCDRLLGEPHKDEQIARERYAALRGRLQDAESEVRGFCPELNERVAALVYGVPQKPRQWQTVRAQLDLAESLQKRAEAQAKRLAAHELDRSASRLRHRRRRAPRFATCWPSSTVTSTGRCRPSPCGSGSSTRPGSGFPEVRNDGQPPAPGLAGPTLAGHPLPAHIPYERGVWGKAHGAATDFRWMPPLPVSLRRI